LLWKAIAADWFFHGRMSGLNALGIVKCFIPIIQPTEPITYHLPNRGMGW